jgi:amino acid transporter
MDMRDGCGALLLAVLVVAVVAVIGVAIVSGGLAVVNESAARAQDARADARRAEADVVEARTSRDREANLHREQMFQMWTLAMAGFTESNSGLLVAVSAVFGALAAGVVIRLLRRLERQ